MMIHLEKTNKFAVFHSYLVIYLFLDFFYHFFFRIVGLSSTSKIDVQSILR